MAGRYRDFLQIFAATWLFELFEYSLSQERLTGRGRLILQEYAEGC
jgi:hypothetical protein